MPRSVKVWQDAWERFVQFLQFPSAARKVIYTTNSIGSFNNELRKVTRNRVLFTNDDSALKRLWLMICTIEDKRADQRAKKGSGPQRQQADLSRAERFPAGSKPSTKWLWPTPTASINTSKKTKPHTKT
ncbi:hypothetical protein JCM12107_21860 [Corynebacterium simulans]